MIQIDHDIAIKFKENTSKIILLDEIYYISGEIESIEFNNNSTDVVVLNNVEVRIGSYIIYSGRRENG